MWDILGYDPLILTQYPMKISPNAPQNLAPDLHTDIAEPQHQPRVEAALLHRDHPGLEVGNPGVSRWKPRQPMGFPKMWKTQKNKHDFPMKPCIWFVIFQLAMFDDSGGSQ